MHVHPQYLTALSLMEGGELALSHHNNLALNDRIVYDVEGYEPVHDNEEGDRIARLLGDKSIMVMGNHGVSVVGPTVHDAFDELFIAERTAMYQITALSTGAKLRMVFAMSRPCLIKAGCTAAFTLFGIAASRAFSRPMPRAYAFSNDSTTGRIATMPAIELTLNRLPPFPVRLR